MPSNHHRIRRPLRRERIKYFHSHLPQLYVLFFLTLLFPSWLYAQHLTPSQLLTTPPLMVNDAFEQTDLGPYLKVFEDKENTLGIEQITSPDIDKQFEPLDEKISNIGFTQSSWWLKVIIVNDADTESEVILRQAYPLIDQIDFWSKNEQGNWYKRQSGDMRPFASRDIAHHQFLFPVVLQSKDGGVFYFRFQSHGGIDISLSAHTPRNLIREISKHQLAYGAYYGGFLVLLFYNLFIFATVRDRAFLHYMFYILSYGTYMFAHNGLASQFFWPNYPSIANTSLLFILGLSHIFAMQFTRHILSIPQASKKLDAVTQVHIYLCTACTAATLFVPYSLMASILAFLSLVTLPVIFTLGVYRYFDGYYAAKYFMLAWSALIVGGVINAMKIFGWLPRTFLTENGFQIASMIEMILLSLALGARVNEIKEQSNTDALTEIGNRRLFDHELQTEFARSQNGEQSLSLILLDIDHFKGFNDTYGHETGDIVLKGVAQILKSLVRRPRLPCRVGGEEFAIILPRTKLGEAETVAERLRSTIEERKISKYQVTVSVGVASTDQHTFTNMRGLYRAADNCLYKAKESGRNCVIADNPSIRSEKENKNQKVSNPNDLDEECAIQES